MGDDTEFTKLPLLQRCTHKLWKARLHGYTEAAKLFQDEDDEKAAIFGQYTGLVSKFVADSNAAAQEKGLEATLYFVQNSSLAGKTVKDVMPAIVTKCVAASKKGTQDLAVQVALMYIEQEKQEAVIEELIKGLEAKNPKIVAACLVAITTGLREFGSKVISVKPIVKPLITLLEDRDKTVRDESKTLTVEIYRWIGDAIKPQLSKLKPIQVTELETEFKKVAGERAIPTRYLRSQQAKQPKAAAGGEQDDGVDGGVEAAPEEQIDPLSLVEPLNILSKIPNDFYEKLEAKKWQERKEALEGLEKILDYPKFEKGDYADLVRALLKIINKDSNVVVAGIATKCLARLVQGLKKLFQPYAHSTLSQLLPKFKEKKTNVVVPLREAVDAIFPISNVETIQEDIIACLGDKNPSIKAETAAFLARSFATCTPAVLNKKILKSYTTALLKTLNESDPTVRDNSAEALGVIQKVVGEKVLTPFLGDIDAMKLAKIKEFSEKAVVKTAQPVAAPKAEPPKPEAPKKVLSGGAIAKQAPKVQKPPVVEKEVSPEVVDEKAMELLPENVWQNLGDVDWNKRLEAMEVFQNILMSLEVFDSAGEIMCKILMNKKPGLKDNNFQVTKLKLECLKHIAENLPIGPAVVTALIPDVAAKFSDVNNLLAGETLMALAEGTNLDIVGCQVLEYALNQKSVKIQQVAFDWTSEAIQNFGLIININSLMNYLKKGLGSTNLAVRTAAASLAGVISVYMGADALLGLLPDEKPSVMNMVKAEIEKRSDEEPLEPSLKCKITGPTIEIPTPAPSQPVKQLDREGSSMDDESKTSKPVARVDISLKITEQLLADLGGKNWKDRNEALVTLQGIVSDAKAIKSNLGELPPILCQRFVDSNGKIIVTALELCGNLATAMGPGSKNQLRNFARGIFTALGDNKSVVRTAAMSCLNAWVNEAGVKEFFQGEVIFDSLKAGSTFLRIELWTWLGDVLPTVRGLPKDNLTILIPLLFAALEDRAVEVRKAGNHAVLGMMTHLGYPTMAKEVEKLKPASKSGVLAILDKVRPDVVEMTPPSATKAKPDSKLKTVAKQAPPKMKASSGKTEPPKLSSRKKDEDYDPSPLFVVNKLKNQRILDEQKLKIIKWNFSSPRSEFVDLLREQMTAAGFNKTLIANMFHADFKFHLKAIDSLIGDLENVDALVANLDLIMKWMTLRFFDTNPSVLLKGLEYLQNAIAILIEMEYQMYDVEANAFIPHLVMKIGDPKDAVRDRVHAILKQFADLYSPGKLFVLIMEGLKSKNSRQRTECLDELGYLIETRGTSVCLPSPAVALKEISKQIADRDNSVRSAALNAIVAAYFVDGDKIYKMIGQLSDKDMSYLEERIKRASQKRSQMPLPKKPEPKREVEPVCYDEVEEPEEPSPEREMEEEEREPSPEPVRRRPRILDSPLVSAPVIQVPEVPKLREIDFSFLDEPLYIPEHLRAKLNIKPPANPLVESIIRDLASLNLEVAIEGGRKLDATLESEAGDKLPPYAKSILDSLCAQLKAVNSYSIATHGKSLGSLYRILLRIINHIFKTKTGISKVAEDHHLKILMQQLLHAMVYEKTKEFQEGGYNKWLAVFIHNIIENSDLTNATVAAVSMQHDIVAHPPSNTAFYEPTSRCLVKAITLIRRADNIDEAVNLERVLFACHHFMQSYPRHTWRTRPSDLPLKAVKTLLLNLVNIKGADIFYSIRSFENVYTSELAEYLKKLVNTAGSGNTKMTREMCNHLSQVFDKIAEESTAKEGMMLLYDFKKQYPNIDLSPVLRPTSALFQEYIADGLKELEKERGPLPQPVTVHKAPSSNQNANWSEIPADRSEQPMYFLNVLRKHQEKLGFPLTSLDILQKSENKE